MTSTMIPTTIHQTSRMRPPSNSSLLNALLDEKVWRNFIDEQINEGHLSNLEEKELTDFLDSKEYLLAVKKLLSNLNLDYPTKHFINKMNSDKKRVVYAFYGADKYLLKVLVWLMNKYDYLFSDNCYSFRKKRSIKNVCTKLHAIPGLEKKYVLKIDVHNYFNSIPVPRLVEKMKDAICDDDLLQRFLENLLTQNKAYFEDKVLEEERGAMAGCPLGGFFANLYLKNVDEYFYDQGIPYFRYSDDIILFSDTEEELEKYQSILVKLIEDEGLEINPDKYVRTQPGESWEFLGLSYKDGIFDISPSTIKKIKRKISKRAKGLYVWKSRKNESFEKVARILISYCNKLFYGEINEEEDDKEFSWKRWYFPVINTSESLAFIDRYMQDQIRYMSSGRHYKGNYKITYEDLKKLGYKSLVNEYYKRESKNNEN